MKLLDLGVSGLSWLTGAVERRTVDRCHRASDDWAVRSDGRCWRLGDYARLAVGEPMALQDIVGECVAEHDGTDLFDAAHRQLS